MCYRNPEHDKERANKLKKIIRTKDFKRINRNGAWTRAVEVGKLKYIHLKSYTEIAEELNFSSGTARRLTIKCDILVNNFEHMRKKR